MYFDHCHAYEELHLQYRRWCKKLHPDAGGDKAEFQQMQNEYEVKKTGIAYQVKHNYLPDLFSSDMSYEYMRRPVTYAGTVDGYYYKFEQAFGAVILIDQQHINLIYKKVKQI